MRKVLGFVFGLSMVCLTGLVSAGPGLTPCDKACIQDYADCKELNQANCLANLRACRSRC